MSLNKTCQFRIFVLMLTSFCAVVNAETTDVTVYPMPESKAQPIIDNIKGAKHTIDLSVYELSDDRVIDALAESARNSVAVRVMLEPKTVGGHAGGADATVSKLKAAGAEVEDTPPKFDSSNNVDHAKFMIIDHKVLLFGTGNLVKTGLGGGTEYNNRDFWVVDKRASAVKEADKVFAADWQRVTPTPFFLNLIVTPENASERILKLIDNAKTTLYIYNQEMFDSNVIDHIIKAKQRNVDTQVILANPPKFFHEKPSSDKNAKAIKKFSEAGIQGLESTNLYVHAKVIVSDDYVFFGSQNFSSGGLEKNRELGEIFHEPAIAEQVIEVFKKDMQAK